MWSDPAAWDGHVPGRNDVAWISRAVPLDITARLPASSSKRGLALLRSRYYSNARDQRQCRCARSSDHAPCRAAGIFHGAYSNPYLFEDCISHGNGTGVEWQANSHNGSDTPQEWIRLLCDGNWVSHKHSAVGDQHTVYRDCLFLGGVRFVDKGA